MVGVMVDGEWVDVIATWAARQPAIARVALYGSRITGRSHSTGRPCQPGSDLDVAIEVVATLNESGGEEGDALGNWICFRERWGEQLQPLLPIAVDLRPIWDDDGVTGAAVMDHGIEIYRRR